MNLINLLLNLTRELTFDTGVGISTVSLWLPSLWPEKASVTAYSTETGRSCYFHFVLTFYLSKRSRDFLWGLGGGKNLRQRYYFITVQSTKGWKRWLMAVVFSSGNGFLFSCFEEKLGPSVLSWSVRAQAIKGLTSLTTSPSRRILYLDGIGTLSISSQPTPASGSAPSPLMPRSLL